MVAVGTPPDGVPCTVRSAGDSCVRFEGDDAAAASVRAVVTADPTTGAETTTPADTVDPRPRARPARPARADGRRGAGHGRRARRPTSTRSRRPDRGRRLPLHGHDRRRPRRTPGIAASPSSSCSSARAWPVSARARAAPACRNVRVVDRRPDRRRPRPVHRPAGVAPDHAWPRPPPTPTSTPSAGRRSTTSTSRSVRADGPVRRLVAAVALRRCRRRVLGGPRGRLDRRRQHARQARRLRAGRRRAAGAPLSRATSRTSSPAARATRSCSTSAAT